MSRFIIAYDSISVGLEIQHTAIQLAYMLGTYVQDKSFSKPRSQAYAEAITHSEEGKFQTQPPIIVNSIATVT